MTTPPRRFPPRLRINAGKAKTPTTWVSSQRLHDEKRGTASARGYGAAWRKLRNDVKLSVLTVNAPP